MKLPKNPWVILLLTITFIVLGIVVGSVPQLPLLAKIVFGTFCGILAARILFSIVPPVNHE